MTFDTVPISKLVQHNTSAEAAYLQNGRVLVHPVNGMKLLSLPVRLDATTLLVCIKGRIKYTINLKEYVIGENDLFRCFASDIIQINEADNVEGYALLLSSDYLDKLQIELKLRADLISAEFSDSVLFRQIFPSAGRHKSETIQGQQEQGVDTDV